MIRRTDDELHLCMDGDRVRLAAGLDDTVYVFPADLLEDLQRDIAAGRYASRHQSTIFAESCKWNHECRVRCWNGEYAIRGTSAVGISVQDWAEADRTTELSIYARGSGKELGRAHVSPPGPREAAAAVEECVPWRVDWYRRGDRLSAVVHKATSTAAEVELSTLAGTSDVEAAQVFEVIPAGTNNLCRAQPPPIDPLAQPFATLEPTSEQVQECKAQPSSTFCRFLSVDAEWPAYAAISAPADRGNLKLIAAALAEKKALRDVLAKRYLDLVGEGDDEWSVAASCRAAEALLEYANLMLEIEPPPKEPEKNPFIDRLWTMAFPVEEQALQQLDKTAELARAKDVDSAYARRCSMERAALAAWLGDPYRAPLPLRARQ